MPLTAEEKQAGRAFRSARQALLDALNKLDPPGVFVLPLWRVVRHECPAAGGASIGITLRETCEPSPEYWACRCGVVSTWGPPLASHAGCEGARVVAAVGRFAFIWKEGKCSGAGCGLAVRTRAGRFVVTADRLAEHGRTHGGQAGPYPGDPRVPGA
jgi:hypothetical protein